MTSDDRGGAIDRAVRAIAGGEPLEDNAWKSDDPTLRQLKVLHEIARLHHAVSADDNDPAASIGAPPPASIGPVTSRWGYFYLLNQIGQGATGVVYRAWDSRLAREVAIKLIPALGRDVAAMLAEARRLARVRHPHFVSVLGVEQIDRYVGIWMELLNGRTLHELVRTTGPLNANEAALIGVEICSALAAVHRAGLLHRDVKAHNVMREHGGRIVLMDLGAAREIDASTKDLAGTPLYLAPELLTGGPATVATDLYSTGVLLFFLTTDALPVEASTVAELKQAHRHGKIRALRDLRPDLPSAFVRIVDRALAASPERRFPSAGEMERALASVVGARAATGHSGPTIGRLAALKMPLWIVALLLVATAIVAPLLSGWIGGGAAREVGNTADATPKNPLQTVAADQLKVARAFEEIATAHAKEGRWRKTVEQYREAERIYRLNTSPDAPIVARARLYVAWAEHHAGDVDQAIADYELAVAKLRDFDLQPLISATLTALASAHQSATRYSAAASAVDGALEARAVSFDLAATGQIGLQRIGLTAADLIRLMPSSGIAHDTDGDWLPDLLEAAVKLTATARDTDGDEVPDGHEDHDGDGLPNYLEFALPLDPTTVIVHYGANDPELLAFEQPENRRIQGQPATASVGPSWRVAGFGLGRYYATLTQAQRIAALERGWRLTTRGTHHEGRAYVNVDL